MCRGEEARSLVTLRVSVLVKNRKKKEILNVLWALESLCMRNFKIPLTPLFFFSPSVCIQAANSHAAVSMAIAICVKT